MNESNQKNGFSYTYSARDREEAEKIREKYEEKPAPQETAMERLRRLDGGVTKKAQTVSLTLGILGVLILGCGMSLVMTDIAGALGMAAGIAMAVGILIGCLGCIMTALAYPLYRAVLRRERARIAPEILRLSEELVRNG